jgi:hypothetical protein
VIKMKLRARFEAINVAFELSCLLSYFEWSACENFGREVLDKFCSIFHSSLLQVCHEFSKVSSFVSFQQVSFYLIDFSTSFFRGQSFSKQFLCLPQVFLCIHLVSFNFVL